MLNRVTLIGRLTKKPELKTSSSGKNFVPFTIAVNNSFNRDRTDFISCFAWDKIAENMVNYLDKGSLISVDGSIGTSNKDGVYNTFVNAREVTFLETRRSNSSNNSGFDNNNQFNNNNNSNQNDNFNNQNNNNQSTSFSNSDEEFSFDNEKILWDEDE